MFPLQCGAHHSPIFNQDIIIEDLGFLESNRKVVPDNTKKRQRISSDSGENNDDDTNERKMRKIMHREIERHRRQEMNNLYTTLRSLLPLDYIKGKRSISDHMNEAVNYIKHMETKLMAMKMRKDELKSKSSIDSHKISPNRTLNLQNCIAVSPCLDGVEILITMGLKEEERFPLWKIVKVLIETGLNVISSVFTKCDGRFLYRIQCEDRGLSRIDLHVLKQRLAYI